VRVATVNFEVENFILQALGTPPEKLLANQLPSHQSPASVLWWQAKAGHSPPKQQARVLMTQRL